MKEMNWLLQRMFIFLTHEVLCKLKMCSYTTLRINLIMSDCENLTEKQ